jgi:hypothetical protein
MIVEPPFTVSDEPLLLHRFVCYIWQAANRYATSEFTLDVAAFQNGNCDGVLLDCDRRRRVRSAINVAYAVTRGKAAIWLLAAGARRTAS